MVPVVLLLLLDRFEQGLQLHITGLHASNLLPDIQKIVETRTHIQRLQGLLRASLGIHAAIIQALVCLCMDCGVYHVCLLFVCAVCVLTGMPSVVPPPLP